MICLNTLTDTFAGQLGLLKIVEKQTLLAVNQEIKQLQEELRKKKIALLMLVTVCIICVIIYFAIVTL